MLFKKRKTVFSRGSHCPVTCQTTAAKGRGEEPTACSLGFLGNTYAKLESIPYKFMAHCIKQIKDLKHKVFFFKKKTDRETYILLIKNSNEMA